MSIWDRLIGIVTSTGNALSGLVEAIRTLFEGDPETRRKVAFSVAMIALSAKMAKADGVVTEAEVSAFRQIFKFPEDQAQNVARLYNLARQDVAGYEAYAEKLSGLCVSGEADCPVLEDIVDGLFHIAKSDGALHEKELAFLRRVAEIFGMDEAKFETILSRHSYLEGVDPYALLGVSRKDDFSTIRRRYRVLVSEHHPDLLVARGVPAEQHASANDRMAAFNAAYAAIERERRAA
ncbi:molecular chaperone DjlA [Rhizobium sp. Leaf384]|jgi:DnaJ like chaperone protein|uniref:J domain-containing protein n=1 Tax=unclassified Rhizobium TaxID=2613769 RepID=UPI000712446E|nr:MULTISPECIES: DnaJ family molecular chaperone [unclassified Rhizobium]KQR69007.1 molecular chaperone DjlA [Rhizobium sp. Leaf341]KQS79420.1 molecular chaperone DjlA [Rhizobium sp. Leaf384]KQS85061.1 molecular chaperone DjlA [Rhizobium sp. Leaf383]